METYVEQMMEDVYNYIMENEDLVERVKMDEVDDFAFWLYDNLYAEDSVTGNASGSYFCNNGLAKEMVVENGIGYLDDAVNDEFVDPDFVLDNFLDENWETLDVMIRVYLLTTEKVLPITIRHCKEKLGVE